MKKNLITLAIVTFALTSCGSNKIKHPYTGNRLPASIEGVTEQDHEILNTENRISGEELYFVLSTHLKKNKGKVGKCWVKADYNEIEDKLNMKVNKQKFAFHTKNSHGVWPRISQNDDTSYNLMNPSEQAVQRAPASAFLQPEWQSIITKHLHFEVKNQKVHKLYVHMNDDGFGDEPTTIHCK